jgi:hypothetical protein
MFLYSLYIPKTRSGVDQKVRNYRSAAGHDTGDRTQLGGSAESEKIVPV